MLGALGAVTATVPADLLLNWAGWRGLFEVLAVATAAIAAVIYLVVPDTAAAKASKRSGSISLKTVYSDARFWRLAPLWQCARGRPGRCKGCGRHRGSPMSKASTARSWFGTFSSWPSPSARDHS